MRYSLLIPVISIVLISGFSGRAFPQFSQVSKEAKKDGWWIRVNTQKLEPQTIMLYVGSASNTYGYWTTWNPGDPIEFDISEEYRNSPALFLMPQTTSGQKCRLCLMYKAKGVRHFEFDLEEGQEVKQSDEDKECK